MFKFKNKIRLAVAVAAASAVTAINVNAAETVTGNASVTVLNSFTFTETTALSFGTLVAIADDDASAAATIGTGMAGLVLAASDGSTTITNGTNATLTEVSAGNAGVFDISGAAPNTVMTITLPGSAIELTDPSGTDTKVFQVDTFTSSVVTSGTAFTFDTDATGNLVFNVGATLSTDDNGASGSAAADAYADATFTGTFTITADY